MARAYLHKIEAVAEEEGATRDHGHARPRPSLVVERPLEDLLERCAGGDVDGLEALLRWQNGRLGATLERMLGDADLTQQALHNLIADLANYSADRRAGAENAENWLFGRLRWHARLVQPSEHFAPPPRAAPPASPSPSAPPHEPAHTGFPSAEPTLAADLEPPAVYARLRRPNARAHSAPFDTLTVMEPPSPSRWRRVVVMLLLWLGAGGVGFAVLALLAPSQPAAPPPLATVVAPPPELPTQPVAPAPPDARALLGPPIAAREPTTMALPQQLAAEDEPMAAPPTALRVVLHYSAGSASGAELARSIAAALADDGFGAPEIREVPHNVATASVRYFRAADRDAAERLVAAARPLLTKAGRAAPVTPIDFTDFVPLPHPGTLEIWVPGN